MKDLLRFGKRLFSPRKQFRSAGLSGLPLSPAVFLIFAAITFMVFGTVMSCATAPAEPAPTVTEAPKPAVQEPPPEPEPVIVVVEEPPPPPPPVVVVVVEPPPPPPPVVKVISRFDPILFPADTSELNEAQRQIIRNIAAALKDFPDRNVLVAGYTARTDYSNLLFVMEAQQWISEARAQAVADYIVQLGVRKPGELIVLGFGADRPIADNSTPGGQALNRRVEVIIQ